LKIPRIKIRTQSRKIGMWMVMRNWATRLTE